MPWGLHRKETPMPRFAANLSMLFTEQDFLAASRLPPMLVSAASNTSSRTTTARLKSSSSWTPTA